MADPTGAARTPGAGPGTGRRWLPSWLFGSLFPYRRSWLAHDVVAGVTVWAVLVPEALAYASIAGVSPAVGLYAAPSALIFYAAFGSSRHLVVGPMSATAALSAAAVGSTVAGNSGMYATLTATLAVTAGVLALGFGLARLGFIADFISEPVLKGFIIGLALTIMIGQVPKLFGVAKGDGDFFSQLAHLIGHLGDTSGWTLLVGAGSLGAVLVLRRAAPAVPGSLAVVVVAIVVGWAAHLDDHGVALVGHIDKGLPHYGFPDAPLHDYVDLGSSAVGIVLVGFAEGLGAAKTYAAARHYDIDANRELIGLGAANVAAGLSSGMVVNGSLSKTAVNGAAGARTQLSGLVVAALTVLTLLFLTGLFQYLPEATLAAVVVVAVSELVDVGAMVRLYRTVTGPLHAIYGHVARADFIAALAALSGVVVFDTLPGLFIGIGISVVLIVYRASRPHVAELGLAPGTADHYVDLGRDPGAVAPDGLVVLRVESGLFFANADNVRAVVRGAAARPGVAGVVLDVESVPAIDVTAARMLGELLGDLRRDGVDLVLARSLGQVRDVLSVAEPDRPALPVYPTVRAAVAELRRGGDDGAA
ncbi:MAG TPA: SulP family inorganic anion transporter [Acidimicrobiales bacterium]|nr:SulP family inorganic anion transporter [Acidimicrobiales bacterium]